GARGPGHLRGTVAAAVGEAGAGAGHFARVGERDPVRPTAIHPPARTPSGGSGTRRARESWLAAARRRRGHEPRGAGRAAPPSLRESPARREAAAAGPARLWDPARF